MAASNTSRMSIVEKLELHMRNPETFYPWDFFNCVYGVYSPKFDLCAIRVLEELLGESGGESNDLGAMMFREMLGRKKLCIYYNEDFYQPTKDFLRILPKLIESWQYYYKRMWVYYE